MATTKELGYILERLQIRQIPFMVCGNGLIIRGLWEYGRFKINFYSLADNRHIAEYKEGFITALDTFENFALAVSNGFPIKEFTHKHPPAGIADVAEELTAQLLGLLQG